MNRDRAENPRDRDLTQSREYTKLLLTGSGKVTEPDGSPFDFGERRYVYAINNQGEVVQVYRSYADYCD